MIPIEYLFYGYVAYGVLLAAIGWDNMLDAISRVRKQHAMSASLVSFVALFSLAFVIAFWPGVVVWSKVKRVKEMSDHGDRDRDRG